jgi:predicted homoserine dehydrogenase-like protein
MIISGRDPSIPWMRSPPAFQKSVSKRESSGQHSSLIHLSFSGHHPILYRKFEYQLISIKSMIRKLKNLAEPIRVGLVGAGCMGTGIAHQISITPGMTLEWIAAKNLKNAQKLATSTKTKISGDDTHQLLREHPVDVFVEATSTIWPAFQYCQTALDNDTHIVLMNAEVDLVFGPQLGHLAASRNLIVTSDAGDQHGVLATMIQEIQLWGFDIIQAGNVKGFLNRHATSAELIHEAAKRNLSIHKCCAFTDGTKLNIEMALLANAFHLLPTKIGMTGPAVKHIDHALQAFDLDEIPKNTGTVDYILGSGLGSGVYLIGKCEDPIQQPYLEYYKIGQGPYYLFKRDYHLCHLETTTAIAKIILNQEPTLQAWAGRITDVYAFAKTNIPLNTTIPHGIGGDHFYGLIAACEEARKNNWVPIALLDDGTQQATTSASLETDQALTWEHLEPFLPPSVALYHTPTNHSPVQ